MKNVNMSLYLPAGEHGLEPNEVVEMESMGLRRAAQKALDHGYVVTLNVNEDGKSVGVAFDSANSPMSMDEFFNILEQAEDESSK